MKTLHLTLKKKWFDMIASGEKKEEYREIKPYWEKRFYHCMCEENKSDFMCKQLGEEHQKFNCSNCFVGLSFLKNYDAITFKNGYQKNAPTIVVECIGIGIGKAKPGWSDNWQGDVFIIKLGKIIKHD